MYFSDINKLDELNTRYKKLAKVLHPDNGGSDDAFKTLKNEYDIRKNEIENPTQNHERKSRKEQPVNSNTYGQKDILSEILANPQFQTTIKSTLDSVAAGFVNSIKKSLDDYANQATKKHS